jgi:hypothetical protein
MVWVRAGRVVVRMAAARRVARMDMGIQDTHRAISCIGAIAYHPFQPIREILVNPDAFGDISENRRNCVCCEAR